MSHNFQCHCEEAYQSHCICFHIKGREKMGVGNPGLNHRKMPEYNNWAVTAFGVKSNTSGREVIYSTSMFNNMLHVI
jgi:hypothetical protein